MPNHWRWAPRSMPTFLSIDIMTLISVLFIINFCLSQQELDDKVVKQKFVNNIKYIPPVTLSRSQRSTELDPVLITYGFIQEAVSTPGAAGYIGCFWTSDQWSVDTADLSPAKGRTSGQDVRLCIADCWEQRLRLAMIGQGSNCFCGGLLNLVTKGEPTLCRASCSKNKTEQCGGTSGLDVYYTGYLEEPTYDVFEYDDIKKVFRGCYEDPKYQVLCNFTFSTSRLNVQMCMEYCANNFFKYAAVDTPDKCCCTMTLKSAYQTKAGKCNLLCRTGRGKNERCGGDKGFLAVYTTGVAEFEGWKPRAIDHPWMRPEISESIVQKL